MEYGLIGAKLGHSYSKIIHEMLCGYHYDLCPLPTEEEARAFLAKRQFKAINVTIPYKKLVMEYCSYIDPRAKAIGAVNTVVNKNGLLYGYNTDYMGFSHLCDAHGVSFAGKTVVILGTGGTHNTTSAVARDKGAAKVLTVSRHPDPEKGELSYAEAVSSGAQIVINTTPAGMYPNVGVCNLDVAAMPDLEAVVDVVYNPDKTELILRAEEAGVPVAVGGLEMLVAQAVYAAEYFLDRKFEDAPVEIRRITAALRRDMLNIALIGMPSSGKTTLGRMLAKNLGGPRRGDRKDRRPQHPGYLCSRGRGRLPHKGNCRNTALWQRGPTAHFLRRRHCKKAGESACSAPERCHSVHRPAGGCAGRGRRQAAFFQHGRTAPDGSTAPSAVSGSGRCRHSQQRHAGRCPACRHGGTG